MALLSRSFVRRRIISLATTLSVSASSFAFAQDPTSSHGVGPAAADSNEQQFTFDSDLAMSNMSRDMMITPTGDVDHDFVAMMIPHHQGAIDMARAELKYGHNEQLRRLAQNIIAAQEHEISVMHSAVGGEPPKQTGETAMPQSGTDASAGHAAAVMNSMKMN
ncbi:uncharacterized protein (DUF305 family) [Bradyrhizobium sp. LM2.7]